MDGKAQQLRMSAITARSFHFGIGKYLEVKMKKVNYKYYARICVRYQLVGCFLFRKENSPRKKEEWRKIWGENVF